MSDSSSGIAIRDRGISKSQIITNYQKNKFETETLPLNLQINWFGVIEISNFEFAWNLVLEIWNFSHKMHPKGN